MTADNAAIRAIAARVLADSDLATPPAYESLGYGAQQVIAGRAAAEGIAPEAYYARQIDEYRAERDRAVQAAESADEAAAIAAKLRGHR